MIASISIGRTWATKYVYRRVSPMYKTLTRYVQIAKDGSSYENDGFIQRCNIDGSNVETVIPVGVTHTPKQCIIAPKSNKLYWCDREGMRVMRSNLDGSNVEVLIISGESEADMKDPEKWCVGVAVDEKNKKLFWTQKGAPKAGKVSLQI